MKPIDGLEVRCPYTGDYGYKPTEQDGLPYHCKAAVAPGRDFDEPCGYDDFCHCEIRRMHEAAKL